MLGQDGDRGAAEEGAIEGAAAAVVAGAGPDGFLRGGIELAGDQARHEAAERGADFVRAGGKVLADEADDSARDAGEAGGNSSQLPLLYPPPLALGSFFQVMRKRLTGSTSQRPTFFRRSRMACGTVDGSFCCAKVGMVILRSRQRRTVLSRTDWLIFSIGRGRIAVDDGVMGTGDAIGGFMTRAANTIDKLDMLAYEKRERNGLKCR